MTKKEKIHNHVIKNDNITYEFSFVKWAIQDDLIENLDHYKALINEAKLERETCLKEEPLFHEDIIKQYQERVNHLVLMDIAKRLDIPADKIMETLSDINLVDLLE